MISFNRKPKTRKGYDLIHVCQDGSLDTGELRIPTVWVTARNGQKFEIPVDPKTGKVPDLYIFARLMDVFRGDRHGGKRNPVVDMMTSAETMYTIPTGGITPEQIVTWWQHPNESDVEGFDDSGSASVAKELSDAAITARNVGKSMVMLMPENEAARARKILAADFNAAELKRAVKQFGLIIKEGNPGKGNLGCYVPVYENASLKTPVIILRPGWSEETLVHEFTHHLRFTDPTRGGLARSPHHFNEGGEVKPYYRSQRREYNSARNLEEACTVSESYVRASAIDSPPNGYYWKTKKHGDTPQARSDHDRGLMAPDGKTAKGRRAEKRMAEKFEETAMSGLNFSKGTNAGNYYRARKDAGTMPKAVKPARKKAAETKIETSGKVPVAASRRGAKKR